MKNILANYEVFRRRLGIKTTDKVISINKKDFKRFCDNFIGIWENRKKHSVCNQDIADGQIKAYSFIKEILTGRKKEKYGTTKDRFYWRKKEEK